MERNVVRIVTRSVMLLLLSLAWGAWLYVPSGAQTVSSLEGKIIVVEIDMPGTQLGVDVYPERDTPLDLKSYSQRIKQYGTALRGGDSVMMTGVKVKGDHIEVQLGGGGFGTVRDDTNTVVNATPVEKSQREKDLEDQVKGETNPRRKERLQDRLDDVRDERARTDEQNRLLAADASTQKQALVMDRREQGGSRFNIRYAKKVPAEALTPDAVMAALSRYARFAKKSY